MDKVISALLVLVGVIHLLPVVGVTGGERIGALYGVAELDSNLEILMRHRAVLFGILGVFLLIAAFRPDMQGMGVTFGLLSVGSFLLLAQSVGSYNHAIRRVVVTDVVALAALLIVSLLLLLRRTNIP